MPSEVNLRRQHVRDNAPSLPCRILLAWATLVILASACAGPPHPSTPLSPVRPDPLFNQLFTRSDRGWTGGDGTLSVALPDGRTVWLFGDSFLGPVRPDGTRPLDSPLVRNCLVVQDGRSIETRHGGSDRDPKAFLASGDPDTWYWPGDGTVAGDRLWIFFHRFRQAAPGLWGWAWDGTVMAAIGLPQIALERVVPVAGGTSVAYGAALFETRQWLYIYGTEPRGAVKHLHVARVRRENPEAPWVFWTGKAWSRAAAASHPILAGVGSQFGVVWLAGGIALVTMDQRRPFSGRVVFYTADAPTGPWHGPVDVYQAPEADADIAAYNAFVHPQFSRSEGYLISYNLNHVRDPHALYDDAALYRPRFIRADLDRLREHTAEVK